MGTSNKTYNRLGIDIGSTTVKVAILDSEDKLLFSDYQRHFANIQETLAELLTKAYDKLGPMDLASSITGSGGLTLAKHLDIPFVQEVVAVATSLKDYAPQTDVAIELGGEDAKIIYFTGGVDQRMNGICAGGTGSFIDQMASLLQTDASGLNELAKNYHEIYPIAARCGVFAKTDIQPLINEGAAKEDLAASIFQAVVNQTISGLACGKPIRGNVAFLGGPLHFLDQLKEAFIRTLHLTDEHIIAPEHSHLFAAIGAAMNVKVGTTVTPITQMIDRLTKGIKMNFEIKRMDPLFASEKEYEDFTVRHKQHTVKKGNLREYHGKCFFGVDAGSTTTKVALVAEDGSLLYSFYSNNNGSPLSTTVRAIREIYEQMPDDVTIAYGCSTGYGEALIKAALQLDMGEVETVAHYYAASFFQPDVDCILDIGGQDMKCIKIKNHTVDSVQLNEACSSGCGAFIETFAKSLNYTVVDFAKAALFAKNPTDLGTRCTVFMNSNVKQAQKEGATVADISAGLAYSVIKNALFKVIKINDASDLGKHVVVQGGTFYNEAVLRAFEKEMGVEVIRPDIAGLMGAYGAALYGLRQSHKNNQTTSAMMDEQELEKFAQQVVSVKCGGCGNHCQLTVNTFADGRKFISGNRCDKPVTGKSEDNSLNLYAYKQQLLASYKPVPGKRGSIGIPLCLGFYELLPFWYAFWTSLGFAVHTSPVSTRGLYLAGQATIPSDTACFPAKLSHGHIKALSQMQLDAIFYPCLTYNVDEGLGDNHYNCPVVAYYPEVLAGNCPELEGKKFIYDYVGIHRPKDFVHKMAKQVLPKYFGGISEKEVQAAADAAYAEYEAHMAKIRVKGSEIIDEARRQGKRIIVLAGRPYHVDPEVNHGIDHLITRHGAAVVTEDSISNRVQKFPTSVLNQWTYHSRLYAAAKYCTTQKDMDLVQLVSFGCGVDAITTDETREILQRGNKLYTQLKIDEITNLGAVNIRLRSLFAALDERDEAAAEKAEKK